MDGLQIDPPEELHDGRDVPPLAASGLAGLACAALLTTVGAWLVSAGRVNPPFEHPMFALLFAIVFGGVSLVEVPLMVFAMRRLLAERPMNRRMVTGLNAVYVLFAAVYALPVFLFTGSLAWGWILSAFALLRLAASLIFVRVPQL